MPAPEDPKVAPRAAAVAAPAALAARHLTVAYHEAPVLWDVSWTTPAAGLIAIVGPNGAGKSTLIKACLGLVPAVSGQTLFFGRPLARVRERVGYLPQRSSVDWDFPASALDVVCMGRYRKLGWIGPLGRRHREAARAALDEVGMADYADRQIGQLSGGQQQRVFLARALTQEADLYLMDEPFAGVDAATERTIVEVLRRLADAGKAVVAVHHDLATAPDYFDQVLILNGRVVAAGPMAQAFTPANLQRAYGGRLALLDQAIEAAARAAAGWRNAGA